MALIYKAQAPNPTAGSGFVRFAEIRSQSEKSSLNGRDDFSVFTWKEHPEYGLLAWRECHGLNWEQAYKRAQEWLGG